MTNYKRFISYLYYYEVGQRRGNIGFARVESSDELCKVTVHCAPKGMKQNDWKVVLLKRQASQIVSETVSTVEIKDGLLDVKLSYEQGVIDPGNFQFKDCIGIVLMYSKDHYIGAKWDESPITYHEADLIEQAIHTVKNKPNIPETIRDISDELVIQQHEPMKEEKEQVKTTIFVVPSEEIKVVEPKARQEEEKPSQEKIKEQETQNVKEKEVVKEAVPVQEKENPSSGPGDEPIQEDVMKVAEELDQAEDSQELVKAAGGSAAAAFNMNQWIDHPAARAILNRFVRMYPFDDGEIAECVRLEPRDIGLLPMTSWPLGNNSFLLHSYCSFRHLLFAKKLTREGCQYYLMVPGTLNPRERQLAKMFGFENFKCSRRRCMRDGEFGYWYIEISFN